MYTWKIVETLENLNLSEWESFTEKTLGTKLHPERMKGFILSRKALQKALEEQGLNASITQLATENHSKLINFPNLCLSLAHTKSCGAALIADKKTFKSVGIDIELNNRPVHDAVRERISHPEDLNLINIEIWCLKEAAFKAIMNTQSFSAPVEFSSIKISDRYWTHSPTGLIGEWELHDIDSFKLALAFLKN